MLWHKAVGAGGLGGIVPITEFAYVGSNGATFNGSSYTRTLTFGTEDSNRWILMGISSYANTFDSTVTSVTIGGVSATIIRDYCEPGERNQAALAIAKVPTGTSGSVTVTFNGNKGGCGFYSYRLVTEGTPEEFDGFSIDNSTSSTLDIGTDSATVGIANTWNGTGHTWTNLTENRDARIGSEGSQATAASGTPSAQSGYSVTCDAGSDTTNVFICSNIIAT